MRIAYIAAGAGGMYCGSCLHDNALAGALLRKGHDVALIPTYTPLRTDDADHSLDRVFYGAINVYLEQKSALFRRTPGLLQKLLDRPALIELAAKLGSSTDPTQLGDMALSVLQGEDGHQKKQLDELVEWLATDYRPDVVHITNSMLLGLARQIKQRVGVPVLCAVQGEDIFFNALQEPYRSRVHEAMVERARDADGLVSMSRFYADYMREYLQVPASKMHHIPLGLQLEGHGVAPPLADGSPFVVGYLARLCPEKGLHLLAEAFRELAGAVGPERVRLRVAGYLGARDRSYVDGVRELLLDAGLEGSVEFAGELDRAAKIEFLRSLHVLSVPTIYREPKGLFLLEALANGVPVVQPNHGAFPELLEATGGGLLVEPESVGALAAGLRELMDDPERRAALGRNGRRVVHERYSDEAEAEATLALYESFSGRGRACMSS